MYDEILQDWQREGMGITNGTGKGMGIKHWEWEWEWKSHYLSSLLYV